MLYNANLALMYGAKFIELWPYFASHNTSDSASGYSINGIIYFDDFYDTTKIFHSDKFYMLRDTLNPRLKGVFGKTLKKLVPTEQHLNIDASSYYNFISHFSGNLECLPSTSDYDLGFFTDSLSRNYFMLISRYYNNDGACPIFINLDEGCLYNNLVLTKFVADTTYNILRSDPIPVNLTRGDAELYRIYPIVRWGGSLLANDTTNSGETLHSDMIVENNATLVINGTYYANADITVKAGGKIKYGSNNSKIIFSNGAKLILEGNAQVYGTSSTNKLTLQYDASTSIGIVVNPGASPIISYCNITGPLNGISVENEATINVTNTSISNCSNTGIALFHFGNGESSSTLSTPNIYKCSISNCGTAISTVNCSEVIIKENIITQCNLGLYFNMVNSAYISSNTILGC